MKVISEKKTVHGVVRRSVGEGPGEPTKRVEFISDDGQTRDLFRGPVIRYKRGGCWATYDDPKLLIKSYPHK